MYSQQKRFQSSKAPNYAIAEVLADIPKGCALYRHLELIVKAFPKTRIMVIEYKNYEIVTDPSQEAIQISLF